MRQQEPAGQREEGVTVMLRNLPCKIKQDELEARFAEVGLAGTYTSIHLPLNASLRANLGYAFVHFTHEIHMQRCVQMLHGKSLGVGTSDKIIEVSMARVQGKTGPTKKSRNRPSNLRLKGDGA